MFDENTQNQQTQATAAATPATAPAPPAAMVTPPADSTDTPTDAPAVTPAAPADDAPSSDAPTADPTPDLSSYNTTTLPSPDDTTGTDVNSGDLATIKQQALQNLSPLLDQLDQTPEEKFRTTMMMLQASDDQSLIKSAYEAAQKITDEKVRAQALLDVVNEINYFTQQPDATPPATS